MVYWRMQLHPECIDKAKELAQESLEEGYIGLDFRTKVDDLRVSWDGIEKRQWSYRLFQSEMEVGDIVLVQVGFNPFALVEVAGEYEFVPNPKISRGVWFRHMRAIRNVRYYDDYLRSGSSPERIVFRSTLMPIRDHRQPAARLIERWRSVTER